MAAVIAAASDKERHAASVFAALCPQLDAAIADARDALALSDIGSSIEDAQRWRLDFDTAVELLQRFAANIAAFAALYDGLAQRSRLQVSEPRTYAPKTPPGIVIANGLRAALMLLAGAIIWYWLNVPALSNMIIMCAIFGALASSSPRPRAMIRQVMLGFLIAVPACFITVFCFAVQANDYPMLVLAAIPLMALGAWLIGNPKRGGMGVGLTLFSSMFLAPSNRMYFDAANYFNGAIAELMGVGLAYLAFMVLFPEHTMGNRKHVAAALWREALAACTARLPGNTQGPHATFRAAQRLRHRFDNRVRDLLSQLNAAAGTTPNEKTRAVVRQGLTLLELGHATIELRALLATSPLNHVRDALQRVLDLQAEYLRAPDAASSEATRAAVLAASQAVRAALPAATPQRRPRLLAALADLHAIYTTLLDQTGSDQAAMDARRATFCS
jgi:uncharacterized membrane protein YccC